MEVNRFFCLLLLFNIETVFAILFSYLKEPQLIIANLTPGSITSRILDREAREGRLQKEGETQSHAYIQRALISSLLQLLDPSYWVGEDRGDSGFQLILLVETDAFHSFFFFFNAQIQIFFYFFNTMTL